MKKLKVAVIGCGRISIMHLSPIRQLSDMAELVAVCDVKEELVRECAENYGVRAYTDYKELIDREELDAVHICLPHYLHTEVACYAFRHGVNVLSEKPMDISYERGANAVKVAKECGVLYGVIFQCRYNESAQLVKKRMVDGSLGKVISARSTLTWSRDDEYYTASHWKGTWDKEGGGVIIDQAIHTMDLVNWVIDSEVENITVMMANQNHKIVKVEDTANGFIKYKNGAHYAFWCMNNYGCDEPIEIRLVCENGKVVFGYNDAYIDYNDGRHEEAHKPPKLPGQEGKEYWGRTHIKQIRQFYNACLGNEELEISGERVLPLHKLVFDIYEKGGMKPKVD